MKKLAISFLCCCFLIACSSNSYNNEASNSTLTLSGHNAATSDVIGGWAPVFFTSLDESSLDDIANGLNSKRINHVVISYPTKMDILAKQIHDYLEDKTHQDIPLKTIELKDTEQVKYNLTQVIMTLYFNK